jgi:hypothetical protein
MELFLVAVILQPTKKERDENGAAAVIVVQPQGVMATDESQAIGKAYRLVPEEHAEKGDRLQVRVLSFRASSGLIDRSYIPATCR